MKKAQKSPAKRKSGTGPSIDKPVNLKGHNRPEYASDAMADTLRAIGFKYAFVNPGSSYRGLHDSMVNYLGNHDPQAVLCAHEDVCVHAAQAYAKASGAPSLAILHDLVGLMHGSMVSTMPSPISSRWWCWAARARPTRGCGAALITNIPPIPRGRSCANG